MWGCSSDFRQPVEGAVAGHIELSGLRADIRATNVIGAGFAMDLSDLYNARIMELAAGIGPARRLAGPQGTASAHSKLCGSTIAVDLNLADGRVAEYGQTVKACLLGQASAAVMASHIIGSTPAELRAVAERMRAMLKAGGDPPEGRWADLAVLEPVKDFKARHASTLLVFEAVEQALAQAERADAPQHAATP
jgi:NifU-like protein involved in Fe-S cluster formation